MAPRAKRPVSKSTTQAKAPSARAPAATQTDIARPSIDEIARRAYEIFQLRGGTPGRALEDWLQAERELSSQRSLN